MVVIRSHRDLVVWQKSMDLVEQVYELTRRFPPDERFCLIAQTRRAAVSVPANLAEGHARSTRRDYAHFVSVAKGSVMELETCLMIAARLTYVDAQHIAPLIEQVGEVSRMLTSLRRRLAEPASGKP